MKALQLAGKVFGRLTVIERHGSLYGKAVWLCKCRCGAITKPITNSLTAGLTKSCGSCNDHIKYPKEYTAWANMNRRCYSKSDSAYPNWGGRGITVCESWRLDFLNFLDDMGEAKCENLSLDRIDVNGNYCKDNCRWANNIQQQNNKRNSILLTFVRS